ncbi:phosphotransferase-like protein [Actinorugispora endophytica]|uniref:phosphotransferase-like protein n=1 Tax=Actinorugispora endophytica TaxID=1605990 RepID=UPI001AADAF20|nr:guanylate kinase [Actinorugispora endophytica]
MLYGPPAAGKDTITAALSALDTRYALFRRLKIGSGRTTGYRIGSARVHAELVESDAVIYSNERYGNVYVIDRPELDAVFRTGGIPVLHLGQLRGVQAVVEGYPVRWCTVLLRCPREVTRIRSIERGDTDTPARLAAWEATEEDLAAHPDTVWDLRLHTNALSPDEAAKAIDSHLGHLRF